MSNQNFTVFGNTITVHNLKPFGFLQTMGFIKYNKHDCECMRMVCSTGELEYMTNVLTKLYKSYEYEEGEVPMTLNCRLERV